MLAGLTQALTQASMQARQQVNSQSTWPSSIRSFSSGPVTAVSHQQKTLQTAQAEPRQTPVIRLLDALPKTEYQVYLCKRPADNEYDCANFGQQYQAQHPWPGAISDCLSKLAKANTEGHLQQESLKIPWVWIARDLIQLLPANSCYRYFLEDDNLFCQFLQQLTSDNVDDLSEPGAKMMAAILCQLAKQDPEALAEYTEASAAVLQRITEVCSTLCKANRSSGAAAYAVDVAGCLLIHHTADIRNPKQQAMKKALHMLLPLPLELQNAACLKLMQPHQSFHTLFLRVEDMPEPLQHCQVSLAAESLERRLKDSKKISKKDASNICEWAIWSSAPVHHNQALVKMVELAVRAHHLLHQVKSARFNVAAVGTVQHYIQLMRQTCQPDKLNSVLAAAQDRDRHAVQLVKWVACLYNSTEQSKDAAAAGITNHQIRMYLLDVANSIQTDTVSMQQISQALLKLDPSVHTHGQLSMQKADRQEPSSHEPPAATTETGELTFITGFAPTEPAAMRFSCFRCCNDTLTQHDTSCCCISAAASEGMILKSSMLLQVINLQPRRPSTMLKLLKQTTR